MKKKDIILEVEDFSIATEDWKKESYQDGIKIGITAWYPGGAMVDDHIVENFSELEDIGIEDETEGFMSYYNEDITAEEMIEQLKELGFTIKK